MIKPRNDVIAVTRTVVEGIKLYYLRFYLVNLSFFEPRFPKSPTVCYVKPLIAGCQYLCDKKWRRQHIHFPKFLLFSYYPDTTCIKMLSEDEKLVAPTIYHISDIAVPI